MIVTYAQESYEYAIDFNWTLVGNTTDSFQLQLLFSKPLSVSVGDLADRLIVNLVYVDPNFNKLRYVKYSSDLPMLIASAE
jgi:hypothetical protein